MAKTVVVSGVKGDAVWLIAFLLLYKEDKSDCLHGTPSLSLVGITSDKDSVNQERICSFIGIIKKYGSTKGGGQKQKMDLLQDPHRYWGMTGDSPCCEGSVLAAPKKI